MEGQKLVLFGLLLAWSFVIFPLASPAWGEDVIENKPGGLPAAGEHGDLTDLARKRYYFRTYDNKNWRYVDLMKALQGANGVQNISLDIPVDYPEVTVTAK